MSAPESATSIRFTNVILLGKVFQRSGFKLKAIDEMFIAHGADPAWLVEETIPPYNSRYVDRVNGWFAGIKKFEPSKAFPILKAVLSELLTSGSTVNYEDRQLAAQQIERIERFLNPPPPQQEQLPHHQQVLDTASKYWESGHYTKAVQNTFVALIEEVARRANRPNQDGDGLMRHVFSVEDPILRLSEVEAEQRGYMDLRAQLADGSRPASS